MIMNTNTNSTINSIHNQRYYVGTIKYYTHGTSTCQLLPTWLPGQAVTGH